MVGSNVYDDGYYGYYSYSYYPDSDCSNVVDVSCGDAPTTLPTTTPHPTSIETYCEEFTVTMEDSYGDGWNGNLLYIGDFTLSLDDYLEDGRRLGLSRSHLSLIHI